MKAEQAFSQPMRDFQKLLKEAKLKVVMPDEIDARIDVEKREIIFFIKSNVSVDN
jgi:hypothetical protein